MSFDIKNKRMHINPGMDFTADSISLSISLLKEDSESYPNDDLKKDWMIIDQWLGLNGNDLLETHYDKLVIGYKAYCMFGNSTTIERQATLQDLDKCKGIKISDLPPEAVQGVFRRLIESTAQNKTANATIKFKKNPKNWLSHLQNIKKRFLWSFVVPITLHFTSIADKGLERYLNFVNSNLDEVIIISLALLLATFVFLSFLNWILKKILPYWQMDKSVRMIGFLAGWWVVLSSTVIFLFEPYGSSISDDEIIHMLFINFMPPTFIIIAKYIYEKHIK